MEILIEAIWKAYKMTSHPLKYVPSSKKEISQFFSFSLSFILLTIFFDSFFSLYILLKNMSYLYFELHLSSFYSTLSARIALKVILVS